ncbi:protein kinase family protein [Kineosporia babensis]|uniref:Protein kinase domain-containing protein n=1 Tax=Kineosporia babensis TaxID=499548 RepID=A0A9X1NBQ8_9ACTN|nr:hypothetical protein [Kineosporia babensis]MCD5312037.1 hypothetical protein [Kineosporia babensis]
MPDEHRRLSAHQYLAALKDPAGAFTDARLRTARPVRGTRNQPVQRLGQHAVVYRLKVPDGTQYALRCFFRPSDAHQDRYRIQARLKHSHQARQVPELTVWEYLPQGMTVENEPTPVLLGPWRSGVSLDTAIQQRLDQPQQLRIIEARWVDLIRRLDSSGIVHGDLQHGNVLVDPAVDGSGLYLVDPDSLWTPALARVPPPAEAGHPNYRHPQASVAQWGPGGDRFSSHVIDLSLLALAAQPHLWERYHDDHNLIFTAEDLQAPGTTRLWRELSDSPDRTVRERAARLAELCRASAQKLPLLISTVKPVEQPPVTVNATPPPAPPQPVPKTQPERPQVKSPPVESPPPAAIARPTHLILLLVLAIGLDLQQYASEDLAPGAPGVVRATADGLWIVSLAGILIWPRARPVLAALAGGAAFALVVMSVGWFAVVLPLLDPDEIAQGEEFYAGAAVCYLIALASFFLVWKHAPQRPAERSVTRLYLAGAVSILLAEGLLLDQGADVVHGGWHTPLGYPSGVHPVAQVIGVSAVVGAVLMLFALAALVRRSLAWLIAMTTVLATRLVVTEDHWEWRELADPWDRIAPLAYWVAIAAFVLCAVTVPLARRSAEPQGAP